MKMDASEVENRALFYYSYTQEPHATRRKQIMEKHPEVKEYFGIGEYLEEIDYFCVQITVSDLWLFPCHCSKFLWPICFEVIQNNIKNY